MALIKQCDNTEYHAEHSWTVPSNEAQFGLLFYHCFGVHRHYVDPDTDPVSKGDVIGNAGRAHLPAFQDNDPVNHPGHYTTGKIEVWDFIVDKNLNFLRGNVVKYVVRAGEKDPKTELQDLEKARAYIDREIKRVKHDLDKEALYDGYLGALAAHDDFANAADPDPGFKIESMKVKTAPIKFVTHKREKRKLGGKILTVRCLQCLDIVDFGYMQLHMDQEHPEYETFISPTD
jgi:hypothetical protein